MDKLKALFNRDRIYTVTLPCDHYGKVTYAYFGAVNLLCDPEVFNAFLDFDRKWCEIARERLISRMYKKRTDHEHTLDLWFKPAVLNPPQRGSKYMQLVPKARLETGLWAERAFFKHMRARPQWWREDLVPDATNISVPVIVLD